MKTIFDLATEYLSAVEGCLVLFERKFGRRDLIRAWREGVFPREGMLADEVKYVIHGVGCAVEFADHFVDFDFSGTCEVGFDAWRLWRYATQFPEAYPDYQDYAAVEIALADGLSAGAFMRADSTSAIESNHALLRLRDNAAT